MKIEKVIKILEKHNKWRRGDDTIEATDPKTLGKALDNAISYLEKYRVATYYKFLN